jgi:hypothetical protein
MKKLLPFLFFSTTAFSTIIPQSKIDFCGRFEQGPQAREILQDLASDSVNLMAFKNNGGLFNGGVCWWHSRFQRNIFYLSIFRPDLEKPKTQAAMKALIHKIRLGDSVVNIPGYSHFAEFTRENQKLIQSELNDWQIYDGVVLGGWMDGLKGDTQVEASVLLKMMKEVSDYVSVKKKIVYQKLQIKGITSHAWLVVGMRKNDSGFDIGYLDSNNPQMSLNYSYKSGDTSFFIKGYGNFVPYMGFKREEERILSRAQSFCGIRPAHSIQNPQEDYQRDLLEAKNAGRQGRN